MGYFEKIIATFENFDIAYVLQFILFVFLFYTSFKVLLANKAGLFIAVYAFLVVFSGVVFSLSSKIENNLLVLVILMLVLLVYTMFNTEIKRNLLDNSIKKRFSSDNLSVSAVEYIIDETVRALQNMSKNDIGALIVLSNDNLPDGIIESGTVINADINAPMIEAVFYPKAPLHDGAMIISDNKIYAAGCFLPIIQNENLPQTVGSRHRAALGVTMVANVTAIVVSEETGIISIVKNGEVKKRYANATDLKNALSEYYWSDLTAEGK